MNLTKRIKNHHAQLLFTAFMATLFALGGLPEWALATVLAAAGFSPLPSHRHPGEHSSV